MIRILPRPVLFIIFKHEVGLISYTRRFNWYWFVIAGTVFHRTLDFTVGGCVGDLSAGTAHQPVYQPHHNNND